MVLIGESTVYVCDVVVSLSETIDLLLYITAMFRLDMILKNCVLVYVKLLRGELCVENIPGNLYLSSFSKTWKISEEESNRGKGNARKWRIKEAATQSFGGKYD